MDWSPAPDMKPLGDDEWEIFRDLLRRYCAANLDQWDMWRTETKFGTVYITISRKPEAGASTEAYDRIDGATDG